jgi:hypothetical protein
MAIVAGCLPENLPMFLDDGRTIVVPVPGPAGWELWTCSADGKSVASYPVPDTVDCRIISRMIGDDILVEWSTKAFDKAAGRQVRKYTCKRFDYSKKQFVPGPAELHDREWVRTAVPACYEGGKCVLAAQKEGGGYDVLSLPDLKKLKSVELGKPMSAGRFWWLDVRMKDQATTGKAQTQGDEDPKVERIDVFDPNGKRVCSIPREEVNKPCQLIYGDEGGPPKYARISDDGTALLLAFGSQGCYAFGLFDTGSGKYLWGGKGMSLGGTPLVKRSEVWSLAQASRKVAPTQDNPDGLKWDRLGLIRYTPADKNQQPPA